MKSLKRSWLLLAMVVILSVFAAACGSGSSGDKDSGAGSSAAPTTSPSAPASAAPSAEPKELTITHQLGETKVKTNPQKVLVFDFGALDTLDKLGINVTGVAQKSVPPYLEKYKDAAKYQNIGTLQEPDYEKISSIKPDLILISGRQSAAYPELSKLAPTVFVGVDTKNYMDSFRTNMKTIGTIFGKEAEVDAELAKIEATIKEVHAKASSGGKSGLIILANEGAISAFGPGSRFGLLHDVLGVPAVDGNLEVSTHGNSITFEYIAEKNPDYLYVVDRGAAVGSAQGSGAKALVENDLVKKTKAYANNAIVYLDQNYWYLSGGGLQSVASMVEEVKASLK